MYVPCNNCRLRRTAYFRSFTGQELGWVAALKSAHIEVTPKTDIVLAGEVGGALYTLYHGWAFRYELLPGGGRQIFDLLLPGDLIGLASVVLGTIRHSVQTLTPSSFCVLQGYSFADLFKRDSGFAFEFLRLRLEEEMRADRKLALLGRHTPIERLGFLMLETFDRLHARELANGRSCPFPLRRQHLADATGLSMIHLNRTLGELRAEKLAYIEEKILVIEDRERLSTLSGYEPIFPSARRLLV